MNADRDAVTLIARNDIAHPRLRAAHRIVRAANIDGNLNAIAIVGQSGAACAISANEVPLNLIVLRPLGARIIRGAAV